MVVAVDYCIQLSRVLDINLKEKGTKLKEHCHELLARF
jgi:hypothetical protein